MNGKLEQAGAQWRLRFERELAHPPEKVWRALTEREHLQAWFPHTIVGEWSVGAPLRFESSYGDFDGEVLVPAADAARVPLGARHAPHRGRAGGRRSLHADAARHAAGARQGGARRRRLAREPRCAGRGAGRSQRCRRLPRTLGAGAPWLRRCVRAGRVDDRAARRGAR